VGGLLFSISGVLYDTSAWRRWLLQLVSRMGLHTHYTCFFRAWERDYLPEVDAGRRDYWEALRAYLLSAGLSPGQINEVEAAGHARRRHLEDDVRPFPGVRATLAQLAGQGVHLAATSNTPWSRDTIAKRLHRLHVAERFQTVIAGSDRNGSPRRPADRFRSALSMMRLTADQTALVSCDSPELAAAAALGLQTVAFNQDGDARADVYLEQFDQLLHLLSYRSARLLAG
jgi:beta-phosphoglucomutase-like phosphatase (HAD superfamily)